MCTGKTSLLWFLQHGRPYKEADGGVETPGRTAGVAIVKGAVWLPEGPRACPSRDMPGAVGLRATWAENLASVQPEGIVYLIDGRLEGESLRAALEEMRTCVLAHYEQSTGSLRTLHVFLNFRDHWGPSYAAARGKVAWVDAWLNETMLAHPMWKHVQSHASATQLSANGKPWDATTAALERFATDLRRG